MMSRCDTAGPGEVVGVFLPKGLTVTAMAKRRAVTRTALSAVWNRGAGLSAEVARPLSAEACVELRAADERSRALGRPKPKVATGVR